MGEKNNKLETIVAIIVLFFVAVILGGVYYKYAQHGHKKAFFYAEFDSVSGLTIGSPVKINGVSVGSVERFSVDAKKNFVVTVLFSVDRKVMQLPEDTRAAVNAESLLGSTVLMLSPGMSEEILGEGATIFDTQSPMNLHEVMQKFLFNAVDGEPRDANSGREPEDGAVPANEKDGGAENGASREGAFHKETDHLNIGIAGACLEIV
jgi:phospholipid/cholesterol/gamma-HCH transport system substrate-binding protein